MLLSLSTKLLKSLSKYLLLVLRPMSSAERWGTARWLWHHMARKKLLLIALCILSLAAAYMGSLPPLFVRYAIDFGVLTDSIGEVIRYSVLLVAASAAAGVANFVVRYISSRYAQEVTHRMRQEVFEAVLRKHMGFFDRSTVGQLISRIANDSERVAAFISFRLRMVLYAASLLVFSAYNMVVLEPPLTAIAVSSMILVVAVYARYSKVIRPLYDTIRQQLGVIASIATSDLVGIKTIKGLNVVSYEMGRFETENKRFADLNVDAARVRAIYGNAPVLILGISSALVILYGAYAIRGGYFTVGGLIMFLTYITMLSRPLNMLGFSIADIQRALASTKRLYEVVVSEERVVEKPDAVDLTDVRGSLEFVNVSFTYPSGRRSLKNINLKVRPGERVLIVGPPGSGKSTLLKLVMRFYDPTEGDIRIDGISIRDLKLSSMRKHVGYVQQEPFIFGGSIYDNIVLGNPGATTEDAMRAARIAKIHDFIEGLPMGYRTLVGERGIDLSGGQRQRIAIARALVRNPKILLIDDPVANLDAETEKALIEDLKEILRDRTALIVTQRLTLVPLADRIVVMNDGEVVEEGSHEELMSRRGLYYKLYTSMVGFHDLEQAR